MKAILSFFLALMSSIAVSAQSVTEYFSVGDPITFCGTDFVLAWSAHPQEIYYVQEYLPQGDSFENYTKMLTVSIVFWDRTPEQAVNDKIAELEQRKQTDPVTNYIVCEKEGQYMLDFIVSDAKDNKISLVEQDLHLYKQVTINGRKACVLTFYSARAYGDDIYPFIQSIPANRPTLYEALLSLHRNLTITFNK